MSAPTRKVMGWVIFVFVLVLAPSSQTHSPEAASGPERLVLQVIPVAPGRATRTPMPEMIQ